MREIRSGTLKCAKCRSEFPILAGVAILVDDVGGYLSAHVKGISQQVTDSEIPKEFRAEYREAKAEIQVEHIEEDLEAERVNALYLMNHYLRTGGGAGWWKPASTPGSPLIDSLVREHWDHGPFTQIEGLLSEAARGRESFELIELGCGVGGLYRVLKPLLKSYLGVDSSFASVALGRHLALGVPYKGSLRIPADLLQGSVSREVQIEPAKSFDGSADLIVADMEHPPLQSAGWDVAVALNTIDMLEKPSRLPEVQSTLLKDGGLAVQSCPYIWHEKTSRALRAKLPKEITDSARAVEWLYGKAGFTLEQKLDHVPWLFFKHLRQLEIYSVHLFLARKAKAS